MAMIILGLTACCICGEHIDEARSFTAFPAFVLNENDPIFMFSDSACHDECIDGHVLSTTLKQRFNYWQNSTGPGNRKCSVCREEISSPNDYFMIDFLAPDGFSASKYNYTHLHLSHINEWEDSFAALREIEALKDSGEWGGEYLDNLIRQLKKSLLGPSSE